MEREIHMANRKLQSCSRYTGTVRNYTTFGRKLRHHLLQETHLLAEGTWQAGGCWTAAEALRSWADGQLCLHVVEDWGIVQHVTAGFYTMQGWVHLDGDGMAHTDELLARMRRAERLKNPTVLPMAASGARLDPDVRADPVVAALLTQSLNHTFGAFSFEKVLWGTNLLLPSSVFPSNPEPK